jgi:hypothetical protein
MSSDVRVFPCGQTDRHRDVRTDMTMLTVVCRNFANAPKKGVRKRDIQYENIHPLISE